MARAARAAADARRLQEYTWAELEAMVEERDCKWVVGPGGVVYDVQHWVKAHPGGQAVLLDAIGCDVRGFMRATRVRSLS